MSTVTQTERLVLRRFSSADLDFAAALLSDPQVMRFSLGVKSRAEAAQWLERCETHYRIHGWGLWAVEQRRDAQSIGYCGLIPQVIDERPEVELSFRLMPEHWGRGLGTEAARAVRRYAWKTLGLDRLISIIEPANRASIRIAEKQGMQLEQRTVAWGRDVLIYAIHRTATS